MAKHSIDYIKSLLGFMGFKTVQGKLLVFKKQYKTGECITVDITNQCITYPESIIVGRNTILNFAKDENFVVLECVDSILDIGYNPCNISLEQSYRGGYIDILIFSEEYPNSGSNGQFAIIECKTFGKKYYSSYEKLNTEDSKAPQIFDYAQQYKSVEKICLYSSCFNNNQIERQHIVIPISDKMKIATNAVEIREAWSGIGYQSGLFDTSPYAKSSPTLTYSDLKEITSDTGKKLYNDFATILRKFVVSDKSNAYNKLFNLFLCKIVDEDISDKQDAPTLKFQFLEGESNLDFMKKLNDLYKIGVKNYLQKEVTDYSDDDFSRYVGNNDILKRMFDELRLFKNSEFSFLEVFNEKSFNDNTEIVKEVVRLLQNYKLKYTHKHPYLGLFFENLLNSGFKQESGQYFTAIPVARFIVSSIPFEKILEKKVAAGENDFLPYIIDYACGSGHFLTEGMDEIQSLIKTYPKNNLTTSQEKKLSTYRDNEYSWAKEYVYGIDFDYRLVKTTKVSTFLNGDGEANVIHANGLDAFSCDEYCGKLHSNSDSIETFDVLLANPPYSVKNFKKTITNGAKRFDLFQYLGRDSDDIECLFVERMGQILCEGAYVGIILPTTLLESTRIQTKARKYIIDNFRVVGLVKLSDQAFMKTGTKTVILFLEKTSSSANKSLVKRINQFFNDSTHQDFSWGELDKSITLFSNECRGLNLAEYVNSVSNPTFNKDLECEQIYTYIKTRQQRVVVVDAGTGEDAKNFLGYDFTSRRGKEGIQEKYIDSNDREIDSKLFIANELSPQKINYYIYNNFLEKKELTAPECLSKNMQICPLSDLIPFEDEKGMFNAFIIMNKPELDKCLLISSKYPVHPLRSILPNSVRKGQSITKTETVPGSIPVVAGGREYAYYHNVPNRNGGIISVSASGAGAGYVNYHEIPIFASDCNTIECSDKLLLKYIYYILQWKQSDIYKFAKGNAQPHIYDHQIYKFLIPVPDDRNIMKELVEKCDKINDNTQLKESFKLSEKHKIIEKSLGL